MEFTKVEHGFHSHTKNLIIHQSFHPSRRETMINIDSWQVIIWGYGIDAKYW